MAKRRAVEAVTKKSEVVTVRFDPKLKYLAELAARKHRRPLSSFIEWAVEQSLHQVAVEDTSGGDSLSVAQAEQQYGLWDLDEPERLVRLALAYPGLLTHEEQLLWKLIRENGFVWKGQFRGFPKTWEWDLNARSMIWERLRQHWSDFRAVATGSKSLGDLPQWQRTSESGSFDDDIPF